MPNIKLITAAVLFSLSANAIAGGAASGGASEVTQIMNNGELVASVSKQSAMVAGQIRDYTVQLNHYASALQNLKNLPVAAVAKLLKPYKAQLQDLNQLYTATTDVYTSSTDAFNVLQRRRAEMQALNLSPNDYLNAEMLLAQTKGGVYKQQAERDMATMKRAGEKSQVLASMDAQINSIGGNVQGLQVLAQQNQMMAGELMELNSQLRTKSLEDNQAKYQQELLNEDNKKRQIALQAKSDAESAATAKALTDGKYDVEANRQKLYKGM
jgi:type IV secretion system protein TrbJ